MKHILSLLTVTGSTLFLTLSLFFCNERSSTATLERKSYMLYLKQIKKLIIATQKTRGLTNYYLNGDVGAKMLIFNEQRDMRHSMDAIKELNLQESIKIHTVYTNVQKQLLHLNRIAFTHDSSLLFSKYSQQIDTLLGLADAITSLLFPKNKDLYFATSTLLPLTENIGKLRGLGAGLVARGSTTESELNQMNEFMEEIERFITKELQYLKEAKHLDHALINLEKKSISMLKAYMQTTRIHVLKPEKRTLTADSYFTEGTKNISEVITIFDMIEKNISSEIDKNLSDQKRDAFILWFAALLVILFVFRYHYLATMNNRT